MTNPIVTTGGPPAPGYNGIGLIFSAVNVAVAPTLLMDFDPKASVVFDITPHLQMLGPQEFTVQLAPSLAIEGGSREPARFTVALAPQFAPGTGTTGIATFRPSITPSLAMAASTRESAATHISLTPSLSVTGHGLSPVNYDATGASNSSGGTTSLTFSHTATAGATVILWVRTANSSANSAITATYGSSSMTQVGSVYTMGASGGYTHYLAAFSLSGAPGGAQTVTVSPAVSSFVKANTVSYTNVTSIGAPVTNGSASGSSWSVSGIASATGHMVTQCFSSASSPSLSSYNQTSRWSSTSGTWAATMQIGDAPGAASVSFTETASASSIWGAMAIDLV